MEISSQLRARLNVVEWTWLTERKSREKMSREIWSLEGLKFKSTKLKKKKEKKTFFYRKTPTMKTSLNNYKLTTAILLPYTTVQSLHVNYATSYYNFIHEKAILDIRVRSYIAIKSWRGR